MRADTIRERAYVTRYLLAHEGELRALIEAYRRFNIALLALETRLAEASVKRSRRKD